MVLLYVLAEIVSPAGAPVQALRPPLVTAALQTPTRGGRRRTAVRWSCTRRARVSGMGVAVCQVCAHSTSRPQQQVSSSFCAAQACPGLSQAPLLALALVPPDTPHEPDVIPTATALPLWNSMAFFKVQPGFSFHSIQVGSGAGGALYVAWGGRHA